MSADWNLIGGNPAPGDVGVLETASGSVNQAREEAGNSLQQVQGILAGWSGSRWSGPAAVKFEGFLQAAAQHLSQMQTAHEPVGAALTAHAATLSEQQPTANRALQTAEQATAKRATAVARRTRAQETYSETARLNIQATSDLARIESAISAVGADVLSLLGEKQTAEIRQASAQKGMHVASGIISEMGNWISDAEAAFSAAIKLADQNPIGHRGIRQACPRLDQRRGQ